MTRNRMIAWIAALLIVVGAFGMLLWMQKRLNDMRGDERSESARPPASARPAPSGATGDSLPPGAIR